MKHHIGELVGIWDGNFPFAVAEVIDRTEDSVDLWIINGCWTMTYNLKSKIATIPAPSGTFTRDIYHLEYPYVPRGCSKTDYEPALEFLMSQAGYPRWYRQIRGWFHRRTSRGRRVILRLKGACGAFAKYWRAGKTPLPSKFSDLEDDIPF